MTHFPGAAPRAEPAGRHRLTVLEDRVDADSPPAATPP